MGSSCDNWCNDDTHFRYVLSLNLVMSSPGTGAYTMQICHWLMEYGSQLPIWHYVISVISSNILYLIIIEYLPCLIIMPDKDLTKFIVRILVTSWSTRRFRILSPSSTGGTVSLGFWGIRFACLGTKILIILQWALSFSASDLIIFNLIQFASGPPGCSTKDLLNLFQFHLRRQRGDAHLNAEAEGAHPQSFRRGHRRPEGMTPWPYPTGELWKYGKFFLLQWAKAEPCNTPETTPIRQAMWSLWWLLHVITM